MHLFMLWTLVFIVGINGVAYATCPRLFLLLVFTVIF